MGNNPDGPDELPFGIEWLASAAATKPSVSVCPDGHLQINRRTCWAPRRLSPDLRAIWFRWVQHDEEEAR